MSTIAVDPDVKESHIKDFDAWLDRKLVEDREILDALGKIEAHKYY